MSRAKQQRVPVDGYVLCYVLCVFFSVCVFFFFDFDTAATAADVASREGLTHRAFVGELGEELGKPVGDFFANRARRVLALVRGFPDRHDVPRVHFVHRDVTRTQQQRDRVPCLARGTQGREVCHHERRRERLERGGDEGAARGAVRGVAGVEEMERHAERPQSLLRLSQTLEFEKSVPGARERVLLVVQDVQNVERLFRARGGG